LIVLDTHAFLWWGQRNRRLTRAALRAIERSPRRGVAAVTLWELARLAEQQRIKVDVDIEAWLEEALAQEGVELLPITPGVAARSTRLGAFHADPADRLIVATALVHDVPLVTADSAITDSGVVETIW